MDTQTPPKPKSDKPKTTDQKPKEEDTCIVCYRKVKYFSVGNCEHSVCYECSSRMRVLMEQNECPICRQSLENVAITHTKKQYKDLQPKLKMFILITQYGLYLEDHKIKKDFDSMLLNLCHICGLVCKDYTSLSRHIGKEHDQFSCELCVDNIKHFPSERKYYNRADLAYHKRKGDRNDTSHRGHPLCKFCERRFFDADELFKHLRKQHYYCHFCDADGMNEYYDNYAELKIHFRKEHFLCEEENCKDEQFTSVYRTEIDLKAHLTSVHSKLLGRHGLKQTRQLDVEFNLTRREDFKKNPRFKREKEPEVVEVPVLLPPENSSQEFPSLGNVLTSNGLPSNGVPRNIQTISQKVKLKSGMNVQPMNWTSRVSGLSKLEEEFPALLGMASSSSVVKHSKPQAKQKVEDFPSLPTTSSKMMQKNWSSIKDKPPAKEQKPKPDFNFIPLPLRKKEKNNNDCKFDMSDKEPELFVPEPNIRIVQQVQKQQTASAQSKPKPEDFPSLPTAKPKKSELKKQLQRQTKEASGFSKILTKKPLPFPIIKQNYQLYSQPTDFQKRNNLLLNNIESVLKSSENLNIFRSISSNYRKNEMEANEYYELCFDMFGSGFKSLFEELVVLLPDIKKQQELLLSHRLKGGQMGGLQTCHVCEQILKMSDTNEHVGNHAEGDGGDGFPTLK